ncbi:MAG: di-trans,poly-cis-decaprenylcistransferase [Clostridiales bacterium 43-6]|nr:MAG: di-trans,poly-cis-decaprenylcistransferase [Clostridiales bacterium 43-6]
MRKKKEEERKLPRHIAIIMDGNGRWAKKRALPRSAGHSAGSKNFKDIARYCNKIGIEYLTVYAFSTENWARPKDEVDNIMNILRDYLKDAKNFKEENIQVKFIGNIAALPVDIIALIDDAEKNSADATGLKLNIALNYGGRDEILHAARKLAADCKNGLIDAEAISEQDLEARLYTAGQPDPDIIIRPSGEYRLSNYLIWQSAYSEFWFSHILWPDFKPKYLEEALDEFSKRDRRFGGV